MKRMRFGTKLRYIILALVCICVLVCAFLYEKSKTDQGTEQDNEFVANEAPDRDTENQEEAAIELEDFIEEVEVESENMIEEIETESEEITAEMVCEKLREVDFTIKEYPINEEIYTEEMDREYKEVFLQVLLNQIPVQYEDGEDSYFEEISSYLKGNSDENYLSILTKAFEYYYIDFDGDALPELVIASRGRDVDFGGPRIWKYDVDSKRVYSFGEYRWTGWKLLGSGKLYYEDQSSAGMIKYGYQEINALGDIVREIMFQESLNTELCTISVDEFEDVEIDKGSWDEITNDFFEAIDHAVTAVTFDELFSDIEHP